MQRIRQVGAVDDAVEAVAGVAEAGNDVADVVEPLVHPGDHQRAGHVQVVEQRGDPLDPLGRGEQADAGDVVGAPLDEEPYGRGQGAAGREHRVQDVALAAGEVVGQPFGVRGRHQRLLVADHADESHLGGRHQPGHALEHAETGAQDRHHQRSRRRQLDPRRIPPASARRTRSPGRHGSPRTRAASPAPRSAAGTSGVGRLVAQHRELVGDERMVNDAQFHPRTLATPDGRWGSRLVGILRV